MQFKLNLIVGAAALSMAGAAFAQDVVRIGHVGSTSGGIAMRAPNSLSLPR